MASIPIATGDRAMVAARLCRRRIGRLALFTGGAVRGGQRLLPAANALVDAIPAGDLARPRDRLVRREPGELAFGVVALLLLDDARRRGSPARAALAGGCVALAIASRTTSLALVPPALLLIVVLAGRGYRLPLAFLAGLAIPPLVEMAVYWLAGADPLTSWTRALGHVRVPSASLSAAVDVRQSPLFNPAYIADWPKGSGIAAHWTVDRSSTCWRIRGAAAR